MPQYSRIGTKNQVSKQDQSYVQLPETDEKREAVRVVITGQEETTGTGQESILLGPGATGNVTIIDTATTADTTYIGEALPGTATSAAAWRIQRISTAVATNQTFFWADGNADFDNIWDNRAALSYS